MSILQTPSSVTVHVAESRPTSALLTGSVAIMVDTLRRQSRMAGLYPQDCTIEGACATLLAVDPHWVTIGGSRRRWDSPIVENHISSKSAADRPDRPRPTSLHAHVAANFEHSIPPPR